MNFVILNEQVTEIFICKTVLDVRTWHTFFIEKDISAFAYNFLILLLFK